jgi:hypothetical protein
MRRLALSALLAAACSGNDSGLPTEVVEVNVVYGTGTDKTLVGGTHAYVVTGSGDTEASCNLLMAGAQNPLDVTLVLLGEGAAHVDDPIEAHTTRTEGVVFVIATNFANSQLYVGCTPAAPTVSVTLRGRGYDCTDPTTPAGAPCDDGDPCTTGEYCTGRTCGSGGAVSCTQYDSTCSMGVCTPGVGCTKQPRACPAPPGQCLQAGVCVEAYQKCIYLPKAYGTACDDGNPCMTGDFCDYVGQCQTGTTAAADMTVTDCDNNLCTTGDHCVSGGCVTTGTATGTTCDDHNPCTIGETCSAGVCGNPTSFAPTTTPCWNPNETATAACYVGNTCSGYSLLCNLGVNDPDFDGDHYYRASNSTGTTVCPGGVLPVDGNDNNATTH